MRSLFARSLVVTLAGTAAGCGGGGGGPAAPNPPDTPSAFVITVVRQAGAQSFNPNPASAGGRSVVFRNADTIVHRVVLNDGTIDTGDIAPGASSRTVTMPTAGTHYHCSIHPTMVGQVNAQGGQPAPPCTGIYCE